MGDELIRPVNFDTGEAIYFHSDYLQKGMLVRITKQEAEEIEKNSSRSNYVVNKVDRYYGTITIEMTDD